MKKISNLLKVFLALIIVTLLLSVGDWLALHDIWHDYVSKEVISAQGATPDFLLPEWSETKAEWATVKISVFFRLAAFGLSIFLLGACLKLVNKGQVELK